MATTNEILAVFVNDTVNPKSVFAVRVLGDNVEPLSDDRPVIHFKVRRPNGQGGWFVDDFDGWECYSFQRTRGKGADPDGVTLSRCRAKVTGPGGNPDEGKDTHYCDNGIPGRQRNWPEGVFQAAAGGSGPRLMGYDLDAADYGSLLTSAKAIDPDSVPLTT